MLNQVYYKVITVLFSLTIKKNVGEYVSHPQENIVKVQKLQNLVITNT